MEQNTRVRGTRTKTYRTKFNMGNKSHDYCGKTHLELMEQNKSVRGTKSRTCETQLKRNRK